MAFLPTAPMTIRSLMRVARKEGLPLIRIDYDRNPGALFYPNSHGRVYNGVHYHKVDYDSSAWKKFNTNRKGKDISCRS